MRITLDIGIRAQMFEGIGDGSRPYALVSLDALWPVVHEVRFSIDALIPVGLTRPPNYRGAGVSHCSR